MLCQPWSLHAPQSTPFPTQYRRTWCTRLAGQGYSPPISSAEPQNRKYTTGSREAARLGVRLGRQRRWRRSEQAGVRKGCYGEMAPAQDCLLSAPSCPSTPPSTTSYGHLDRNTSLEKANSANGCHGSRGWEQYPFLLEEGVWELKPQAWNVLYSQAFKRAH